MNAQSWRSISMSSKLADDTMESVFVEGREIAIYRIGGCLYATDNLCTHGRALLTDGWLEDAIIECPLHGGRFEVATGKGLGAPIDRDLTCYPIREIDDRVEIELPTSAS